MMSLCLEVMSGPWSGGSSAHETGSGTSRAQTGRALAFGGDPSELDA